jgi:hypothetical protein
MIRIEAEKKKVKQKEKKMTRMAVTRVGECFPLTER